MASQCYGSVITLGPLPAVHIAVYAAAATASVLLAIWHRQVKVWTPILCNAGGWFPSYYVFGAGLAVAASLLALSIWAQFGRLHFLPAQPDWVEPLNVIAVIFGSLMATCLGFMGFVSFHDYPTVHNVIAITYMVTGLLYQIFVTAALSHSDDRTAQDWRVATTVLATAGALSLLIPATIERRRKHARAEARIEMMRIQSAEKKQARSMGPAARARIRLGLPPTAVLPDFASREAAAASGEAGAEDGKREGGSGSSSSSSAGAAAAAGARASAVGAASASSASAATAVEGRHGADGPSGGGEPSGEGGVTEALAAGAETLGACGAQAGQSSEDKDGFPYLIGIDDVDGDVAGAVPPPPPDAVNEFLRSRGHSAGDPPRHLAAWGLLQYLSIAASLAFFASFVRDLDAVRICFS